MYGITEKIHMRLLVNQANVVKIGSKRDEPFEGSVLTSDSLMFLPCDQWRHLVNTTLPLQSFLRVWVEKAPQPSWHNVQNCDFKRAVLTLSMFLVVLKVNYIFFTLPVQLNVSTHKYIDFRSVTCPAGAILNRFLNARWVVWSKNWRKSRPRQHDWY